MIVERSTPQCSAHWATDMSPVSTCTNAWYFSAGVKNRFARRPPRSRACFGSGISGSPHESHDPSHMRTDRGPRSGHELRRKAHSEAAWAHLCGVAPIPAGSGKTNGRHRLNPGGNRQANHALWRIVLTRLGQGEPRTVAY